VKKSIALSVLFSFTMIVVATAAIQEKVVTYTAGDLKMNGYLFWDDAIRGTRPGVLVVHEWWGLDDYARHRAHMLAGLGYTALALDMFGNGKHTTHAEEAMKFYQEVTQDMSVATARFIAAMNVLKEDPNTDKNSIAAIGYCFGGGLVLAMAREGVDLRGVASFHGGLHPKEPAKPGIVKAKVRVYTGADDPYAPPEDVEAFKKEMANAKVDYQVISYPGAKHSFTNPAADAFAKSEKMPLAYNAEADKKSWADLQQFLKMIFASK
jgi:dienelactone hydrolase